MLLVTLDLKNAFNYAKQDVIFDALEKRFFASLCITNKKISHENNTGIYTGTSGTFRKMDYSIWSYHRMRIEEITL